MLRGAFSYRSLCERSIEESRSTHSTPFTSRLCGSIIPELNLLQWFMALSVKKKKKVAGAANEFAADFLFECSAEDKIDRDDAALKKYLRKEAQSTLDEKIAAIRKAKNTAKDVEIEEINDDENVEQLGALDAKG
ncbi:unnamed protein product [Cylicostephanus goldi]|uniref:Uncharacterized protein n=1 Tax=Cylicostephanus goldi TaxID=71465 RepID=A0A3P7N5I0_CYLGO|nr:unnamed protein product [Cylicostephanus goldi]